MTIFSYTVAPEMLISHSQVVANGNWCVTLKHAVAGVLTVERLFEAAEVFDFTVAGMVISDLTQAGCYFLIITGTQYVIRRYVQVCF